MSPVVPRFTCLLTLAMLWIAATPVANAQSIYEPYSSERLASLQAEGKTVLVDVFADWCPTCRAQSIVLDAALREPRYADLAKLKVDWDDQRDAARALGAPRQSTLLLFRGGKRLALSVAETGDAKLREFLDKGVNATGVQAPKAK
ncbi:MAG: thioredoxin domain-containing protein [Pseudomarimonas sp.]